MSSKELIDENKNKVRPTVTVQAQTANTIGISIQTEVGSAWLIVGQDGIIADLNNLEIEVRA